MSQNSSALNSRGSRFVVVITLTLLAVIVAGFVIMNLLPQGLFDRSQSLLKNEEQPAILASPTPVEDPGGPMLQDPRYWTTIDVVYHIRNLK